MAIPRLDLDNVGAVDDPSLDRELDEAFAHHQALRLSDAEAGYRRILAKSPNHPDALHLLGLCALQSGHGAAAIELIRRAIANQPNAAEYHLTLGVALQQQGDLDGSIGSLQSSLRIGGDNAQACFHLGAAMQSLGRLDEAIDAFTASLRLSPANAAAATNLAVALDAQGRPEDAMPWYRRAVDLDPSNSAYHSNLLYATYFHPDFDALAIRKEHDLWRARHADPLKTFIQLHHNNPDPDRPLKIGFVSPDFRQHVVSVFMLPLLAHLDRRDLEITCYADVPVPDAITAQVRAQADRWRDIVGLPDDQVAQQIRDDGIDILIDLSLHMARNRLLVFARKPAPVQVTYLGYAGTTGLDTIDYRFTDPYLDPPDDPARQEFYSERSFHLPQTYWGYSPISESPVTPLPAARTGTITFGCLNNPAKVNKSVVALWARILTTVRKSRLLLHAHHGSQRDRLIDTLRIHGVDRGHIDFAPFRPVQQYYQTFSEIDIALDPFPCAGGTSTFDALWMGVPVVTLAGQAAIGRAGVSICSNVGLTQLIAHSQPEYITIAERLAADRTALADLRTRLRDQMRSSPAANLPRFAQQLTDALRRMWRDHCHR